MGTAEADDQLRSWMLSSEPGSVLTIDRPSSINVELNLDPDWSLYFERLVLAANEEQDGPPFISSRESRSGLPLKAVVPIVNLSRWTEWHERTIPGNREMGYPPSKVHVRDHIKCELGFAVTIHKAGKHRLKLCTLAL